MRRLIISSWFILVLTLQCLTPTPTTWVQVHALRFDLPNGPTPTVTVGQQATATWIANSPNDQNGFVLLLNCDTSDNPDNFSFSNLKSDLTPVFPHRQTQGEFSRNVTQAGSCHFQGYQVQFHDFKGQTVKLGASDPLLAVTSPEAQAQPLASTPTQTGAQATTQSSTTSPTRTLTPGSTSSKTSSSAAAGGGALGSETSEISQASTPTTAHAEGGINSLPLNDPGSTTVTNFSTSTVTAASTTSSLESSNNGEAKNDKEKIILGSKTKKEKESPKASENDRGVHLRGWKMVIVVRFALRLLQKSKALFGSFREFHWSIRFDFTSAWPSSTEKKTGTITRGSFDGAELFNFRGDRDRDRDDDDIRLRLRIQQRIQIWLWDYEYDYEYESDIRDCWVRDQSERVLSQA
ncbi:hypothetical protein D9758_004676 [Tetrapyrgos nigripes]|uniref:Uncharacterized protein n=1 Tax=Tetrapyrgos nigripes TaxID=182062 RepID=A0A8H5H0U6_9AGAR|nr:hypothetical protein D9758_004676 [Tetrapyrgos nigripes]